jgi:hypothetical protein
MSKITINRAPVLTLRSFVVAQRLGHSRDTTLTLAKAVGGMSAFVKAKSLGLAEDRDADLGARQGRHIRPQRSPRSSTSLDSSALRDKHSLSEVRQATWIGQYEQTN